MERRMIDKDELLKAIAEAELDVRNPFKSYQRLMFLILDFPAEVLDENEGTMHELHEERRRR